MLDELLDEFCTRWSWLRCSWLGHRWTPVAGAGAHRPREVCTRWACRGVTWRWAP